MGITRKLARTVFSRSQSVNTQQSSIRRNVADKKRWGSVRSYLCGDEFTSVLAEEDSASIRSSDATVMKPKIEELKETEDITCTKNRGHSQEEKQEPTKLSKEDAAIVIQSAFRGFLVRRRSRRIKTMDNDQGLAGIESPSRVSVGTSIEVLTGNSVEAPPAPKESTATQHHMQHKAKTQMLKSKEEWDDSTVSSNISKMRIQNKLEATTRRERALAYAFSQQLRICSRRKQAKSEGAEFNTSWSWLERWMATRIQEGSTTVDFATKQREPIGSNHKFMSRKMYSDVQEEKESCGSNEVSVQMDLQTKEKYKNRVKPSKNKPKATSSVSRRKTVPSYHWMKDHTKVSKKDCSTEMENDKNKQAEPGNNKEMEGEDHSSQQSCNILP
ncbi:IQ motif, EF-hand binding site [Dillenia turbinata]|uniref:IQ motif, EF-hand binding site n=1 Tax=Dillenia turbinata TaxID=194707 RepID=A0AAN8V0T3_9MAGN